MLQLYNIYPYQNQANPHQYKSNLLNKPTQIDSTQLNVIQHHRPKTTAYTLGLVMWVRYLNMKNTTTWGAAELEGPGGSGPFVCHGWQTLGGATGFIDGFARATTALGACFACNSFKGTGLGICLAGMSTKLLGGPYPWSSYWSMVGDALGWRSTGGEQDPKAGRVS